MVITLITFLYLVHFRGVNVYFALIMIVSSFTHFPNPVNTQQSIVIFLFHVYNEEKRTIYLHDICIVILHVNF